MKDNKKKLSWWQKLLSIIFACILGIVSTCCLIILIFNLAKFAIYGDYFSIREVVCTNHGLNNNYVSQGTAITDDGKYIITSGYMSDKTSSRIYITEVETDKTHFVKLKLSENKDAKYHFGGVAVANDTIYLANGNAVFTLSLKESLNNDTMIITKIMDVNNAASFIFTSNNYLYVGEFYDEGYSDTINHTISYNNKNYHAIVEQYPLSNLNELTSVYAIRNKVQGFALNENGDILLSTSYGLDSSNFYYYKSQNIIDTKQTYLDAPLYVLEEENLKLVGPAMSEDLDYLNGKFYTNFESSSNKYVFGKLFNYSDKIVSLDFSKIV